LVSACLVGERVRFDGKDKLQTNPVLQRWLEEGRVVRVCPEVAGGLPVPRPPAEISKGLVMTQDGRDVSDEFERGAKEALRLVREHGITLAVLKSGSPSCGSGFIYDGSFSKTRVAGDGVTTALLQRHGVRVFSELDWDAAAAALRD
ncbi:MAG: DUF523 domain-containing protein, partial [Archangium sp.]